MPRIAPGERIANKYLLVRPLAEGGMGAVWVARHEDLDVEVAIKFIAPGALGPKSDRGSHSPEARFQREARAAARLKSPYVTQIHDYGVDDGLPYLVMELLEGEDLDARLSRLGKLPPAQAAALIDQLCRGLQLAHDAGIVHRDLKPSNVYLARVGDEEIAKILDFGIAKHVGRNATHTDSGAIVGTPLYMSPEQTQGARLDPRSDLWSLGVMAFRVLTGRVPFPGEVIWEIVAAICTQPVPSASDHELPATLDRFFARALARNLERRIDTAKSFARAFRAAVEGRDAELDDALAARAGALAETVPSWRPESGRPSSEPLAETREQAPARVGSTTARAVGTLMPRSEPRGASLLKSVGIAVLAGALVAGLGWFAGRRSASQGPIDSRDAAATAATTSAAETAPVRAVESPIGSGVDARAASAATTVQSAHAKSPAVAQAPAPVAASASPTARPSASPAIPSATASPPPASKPSSNEFGI